MVVGGIRRGIGDGWMNIYVNVDVSLGHVCAETLPFGMAVGFLV